MGLAWKTLHCIFITVWTGNNASLAKARLYIKPREQIVFPLDPPEDQSLATNGIEEGSEPFSGPFTDGLGHIGFCGPDMTIDTFSPVSQDKSPTPMEVEPERSSHQGVPQ